jgi:superfamily II DNA/RNA helicase
MSVVVVVRLIEGARNVRPLQSSRVDVFEVRQQLVADYSSFTSSFVEPRDSRIKKLLEERDDNGSQWPEPWLSLNPNFESGGTVDELVAAGVLHSEAAKIFSAKANQADTGAGKPIAFHRHQREAIEAAATGESYVLTTGTGSGKSLAYIVPIVDRILRAKETNPADTRRIKAIIVYPMNALANSQMLELEKFLKFGYPAGAEPVTFARYTGQERPDDRAAILAHPPDIILTNYVMLDLVLTRPDERQHLIRAAEGLDFLVLDELHTYRGRQGSDVAMLVRRVRNACNSPKLQVVGTSATMASGGTAAERAVVVAGVASRLFGTLVRPERIIGETLLRATTGAAPTAAELSLSIHRDPPASASSFVSDPLAAWVESTFGVAADPASGQLVRQRPTTVASAGRRLAIESGVDEAVCVSAIQRTLLAGSRLFGENRRPIFAFRLHQFLSKGDTVYASLESEEDRYLTDRYQLRVPESPEKVLLPLGFCRECGQEYYVVAKSTASGADVFVPRHDADASGGDAVNGYLYISTDHPWPLDPVADGRVPEHWLQETDDGTLSVQASRNKYLPTKVYLRPDGTSDPSTGSMPAWFISTPFSFCLRCAVTYDQVRSNDFSKLATLDQEGRSSAMTVVSTSVVRSMRAAEDLAPEARKLLTFVDNRQDASLQAGHFNDYVQVTLLRGALATAASKHADGLSHDMVAQAVSAALAMKPIDYAIAPEAIIGRDRTEKALRQVVEYRLYVDLKRGWRVTMPNLEQVGLLRVVYEGLDELGAADEIWTADANLAAASPGLRTELMAIMLDEFRRVLAIDVDCLTPLGFEQLQRNSRQHLNEQWQIGEYEQLEAVGTAIPRPGRPGLGRNILNLTGRGGFGRYLRSSRGLAHRMTVDEAQQSINTMLSVLAANNVITLVDVQLGPGGRGPSETGYRLRASSIRWVGGDGTKGATDALRKHLDDEAVARVNPFFRGLYRDVAHSLTGLLAKEHTAQVPSAEREDREERFRAGTLPLLYCSPTMELGVDIASLNAVGMRNVPPTPANYAQRSGRAGRSGQPALVVTYCSTGNSHDTYWFRRSDQMVAGSVQAPRLDLTNEELIRSHIHAVWLAETGQSMRSCITDVLEADGNTPSLNVRPDIWKALIDPDAQRRAEHRAADLIAHLRSTWRTGGDDPMWFTDDWLADVVRFAPQRLDDAFDRWRDLYRTTLEEYRQQGVLAVDTKANKRTRQTAAIREREARERLAVLRNDDATEGQTDFYSYRYLASEGFLPGYSFPRLPLAAYIPGGRPKAGNDTRGDYLQRPRFLAISEFGPGALIYHEGARFEVNRIQLPRQAGDATQVATETALRCEACGYHHLEGVGVDRCEACNAKLGAKTYDLLRLQTVHTRRRERISSDEEERRRSGFDLEVSYRFSSRGDRPSKLNAVVATQDGEPLLEVIYGDAATIRIANVGRRRRKVKEDRGFWLHTVEGRWLSDKEASEADTSDDDVERADDVSTKAKVTPFVEDTRNVLVVRFALGVTDAEAASLRYALERGIEAEFHLEDSELSSQALPDIDERGRFLLTESAEGGAGVLRRLASEPDALARAARRALDICHFNPVTGADLGHPPGVEERCERGCYDCLLSYNNQFEHAIIDRMLVQELLFSLSTGSTAVGAGGRTPAAAIDFLEAFADSSLERKFIDWLAEHGYRLPDRAQVTVSEASAKPDFVYDLATGATAVFIDGPVHDAPHNAERDAAAEERLVDLGWHVLRWRYDDDWASLAKFKPSVFGRGRG